MFDKQLSRDNGNKKKSNLTTPFYNPKFDLIKERIDAGVLVFEKQSSRKFNMIERNCLNDYDIEDVDRGLKLNSKVHSPRFDKMGGRED